MVCKHGLGGAGVVEDDMHVFDFCTKEWSALKLVNTPPPVVCPFINTYGSSLLQFGGGLPFPSACMLLTVSGPLSCMQQLHGECRYTGEARCEDADPLLLCRRQCMMVVSKA